MEYLLLIHEDKELAGALTQEEQEGIFPAYGAFTEEMVGAGVMRDGKPLQPVTTATTIRVRDGGSVTTDGPFAETKEQLAGYYLIDCNNLDEAMAWAAKVPSARFGAVEIRPVQSMG